KKNTWLRNAKCFILESVPTTNTLVLHLKSESKIFYSLSLPSRDGAARRERRGSVNRPIPRPPNC
ncbi:hypothetical protein, partial [Neisseria meningitidis]|uniref:hypothetical protein n=1 Tax=Neisseria meningitidis TaxID=487 RepID=UPI001E3AB948